MFAPIWPHSSLSPPWLYLQSSPSIQLCNYRLKTLATHHEIWNPPLYPRPSFHLTPFIIPHLPFILTVASIRQLSQSISTNITPIVGSLAFLPLWTPWPMISTMLLWSHFYCYPRDYWPCVPHQCPGWNLPTSVFSIPVPGFFKQKGTDQFWLFPLQRPAIKYQVAIGYCLGSFFISSYRFSYPVSKNHL